jgi:hypothetical protein
MDARTQVSLLTTPVAADTALLGSTAFGIEPETRAAYNRNYAQALQNLTRKGEVMSDEWLAWAHLVAATVAGLPELGVAMMPLPAGNRRRERERRACERCNGTGRFITGTLNGQPVGPGGPCFRCGGKGYQTRADGARNWGYDNFYQRVSA